MKSLDTLSRSTKAGFSGKSIPVPLSGNSLPCLSSLRLNDWELIGLPEESTPPSKNIPYYWHFCEMRYVEHDTCFIFAIQITLEFV